MYLLRDAGEDKGKSKAPRVQLMAAGGSVREAVQAAELLEADFGCQGRRVVVPQLQRVVA